MFRFVNISALWQQYIGQDLKFSIKIIPKNIHYNDHTKHHATSKHATLTQLNLRYNPWEVRYELNERQCYGTGCTCTLATSPHQKDSYKLQNTFSTSLFQSKCINLLLYVKQVGYVINYTAKPSDVWCIGVIAHCLVARTLPTCMWSQLGKQFWCTVKYTLRIHCH